MRCNAGDRSGEIGRSLRRVEVMDAAGKVQVRERDELSFATGWSNLDDPVLLRRSSSWKADTAEAIVKHMRKAWIQRKARQPLSFQASARIFENREA